MTRFGKDSIPPPTPPGVAAKGHFTAAVNILSHHPVPRKMTFDSSAQDITALATRLVALLKEGTTKGKSLSEIDEATARLTQKCLEIQQATIKARKDGAK